MLGPVGVEGTLLGRSFTGIERRPLVSAEPEPRSYFYDFYVYVRRLKVEFLQYTFETLSSPGQGHTPVAPIARLKTCQNLQQSAMWQLQ